MSIFLKQLEDIDETERVLNAFSSCLQSLSSGSAYRRKMAEKFVQHGIVIAAADGNQYAGFAAFYANDLESRTAFLSMIAVQPDHRGKHIGNQLLDQCIERSVGLDMKKMRLEVRKANTGAIHFYEKNGFQYVGDSTDSSIFMEKAIGKDPGQI